MDYFDILPLEITLDILTRLPTESILDSKLVCTSWRSVVAHPSFAKTHFDHHLNHPAYESSGKLGYLVSTYSHDVLYYFDYHEDHDHSTEPIQRIKKVNLKSPFKDSIFSFVGSINGLICLRTGYNAPPSVWICNPITKECVILPDIKRDSPPVEMSFGYVSSTNEYKIIGFYASRNLLELEVHIYTLGSGNGWRNLGEFNFGPRYLHFKFFFAGGALYWLDLELKMIGTFDLAEEKFGKHLSPPHLPSQCNWYYHFIGVLDVFLFFALADEKDGFFDTWVLKKKNHNHDKEEGEEHQSLVWNKEFRINDTGFLAVSKSRGILIGSGNYLKIYDTKTSTSKSLVNFKSSIIQVFPHKNTLVSLKELGEEAVEVMESAQIEEAKSGEQPQEDADPECIYL